MSNYKPLNIQELQKIIDAKIYEGDVCHIALKEIQAYCSDPCLLCPVRNFIIKTHNLKKEYECKRVYRKKWIKYMYKYICREFKKILNS